MAPMMDEILKKIGLERLVSIFEQEEITPDIVSKLSLKDMHFLNVHERRDMMNLRTECVQYGYFQPPCVNKEFKISKCTLETLMEAGHTISGISKMLSVSESTISRNMRRYNLRIYAFNEITDDSLDSVVEEVIKEFPRCGEVMIKQILIQRHIKVQRDRLRDSLHRVDEDGIQARKRRRLHRKVYNVAGPNFLWHIDTNHKLIRWHFIIIGGIDGFTRFITLLECTDNNRADTVLRCFIIGVQEFGVPLQVRSDKGMENSKVADYMIRTRGPNRRSMITGKSTHNQRIERLWRDVYEGVLGYYYDLFSFMEEERVLDVLNDIHIFALHYVFLSKINEKLTVWRSAWARHRVRTVKASPITLFSAGVINSPIDYPAVDAENNVADEVVSEEQDSRPIFVAPSVAVSDQCLHELEIQCPAQWQSTNYGIDIFIKEVHIIENFNHR